DPVGVLVAQLACDIRSGSVGDDEWLAQLWQHGYQTLGHPRTIQAHQHIGLVLIHQLARCLNGGCGLTLAVLHEHLQRTPQYTARSIDFINGLLNALLSKLAIHRSTAGHQVDRADTDGLLLALRLYHGGACHSANDGQSHGGPQECLSIHASLSFEKRLAFRLMPSPRLGNCPVQQKNYRYNVSTSKNCPLSPNRAGCSCAPCR